MCVLIFVYAFGNEREAKDKHFGACTSHETRPLDDSPIVWNEIRPTRFGAGERDVRCGGGGICELLVLHNSGSLGGTAGADFVVTGNGSK